MNGLRYPLPTVAIWWTILFATTTIGRLEAEAIPSKEPILFDNVQLVDTAAGTVLPRQSVFVNRGRIEAIGDRNQVSVPTDTRRIRGGGRYLMPGLTDMHVHLEHDAELAVYLANGITTIRHMDGLRFHLLLRQAIKSGKMLGPQMFVASPFTDGNPPVFPDNVVVRSGGEAREAVRMYDDLGYDFVKIYSNLAPSPTRAILKEAHKRAIPVVGHVPWSVPLTDILKTNLTSMEHLFGMVGTIESNASPHLGQIVPQHMLSAVPIDEDLLPELAADIRDSGIWTCATLVAIDRLVVGDEARTLLGRRVNRYVSRPVFNSWASGGGGFLRRLLDGVPRSDIKLGRRTRRKVVSALADAGAPLIIGTDAGSFYVEPGFSLHAEIQAHRDAGLSTAEILRMATVNAAEALGRREDFGTIEVGKRADLILVDKNPLRRARTLRKPRGVMVAGRWLSRPKLREMLRDAAAILQSQSASHP